MADCAFEYAALYLSAYAGAALCLFAGAFVLDFTKQHRHLIAFFLAFVGLGLCGEGLRTHLRWDYLTIDTSTTLDTNATLSTTMAPSTSSEGLAELSSEEQFLEDHGRPMVSALILLGNIWLALYVIERVRVLNKWEGNSPGEVYILLLLLAGGTIVTMFVAEVEESSKRYVFFSAQIATVLALGLIWMKESEYAKAAGAAVMLGSLIVAIAFGDSCRIDPDGQQQLIASATCAADCPLRNSAIDSEALHQTLYALGVAIIVLSFLGPQRGCQQPKMDSE